MSMRQVVNRMINFKGKCCISIAMKTHRTRPDFERDPIQLKNLIKVAEEAVYEKFDKRFAADVIESLKKLAEQVDHGNNLDSLMLFVNENFAEGVKLEIPVQDKVVVAENFLIRDLLYAQKLQYRYFILVLGKEESRLLEAINNRLHKEYKDPFPIVNTRWVPENAKEASKGNRAENLLNEYFNVVDKQLNVIVQQEDYPVIVATEASNFPYYQKMADNPGNIIGHLPLSLVPKDAQKIVTLTWEQVTSQIVTDMKVESLKRLELARSSKNWLTAINEVYQAIIEGRGQTLFVKTDYHPDYILEKGAFVPMPQNDKLNYRVIDPVDTIIRELISRSGELIIIPHDTDTDFEEMALITRY